MKRQLTCAAAAVAALLHITPISAQEVELSLGHVLTDASHYHAAASKMAEIVETKSNGRIKINIFPAGQLGGEVKMIQSLRTGTQDLLVTGEAPLENTVKEYSVFSFPYIFEDLDQANAFLMGPGGREMLDLLPQHGMIGLNFISALERNIFTNGKEINSAEDMKGLKIRVIQGPGYVATYEALGAQPTPMAYSELYMSLQNGAIDAAENSPDLFLQDRFVEVSKTFSLTKAMYMPAVIVMSESSFKNLSEEDRKLIQDASDEASTFATEHYKKSYAAALEAMKSANIKIIEPDLDSFRKTGPAVHAKLLQTFPQAKPYLEKIQAATK